MKKEGGCEWYQSIGLYFVNISADFKIFFKGPRPFKFTVLWIRIHFFRIRIQSLTLETNTDPGL
jgi:hypothetical protein